MSGLADAYFMDLEPIRGLLERLGHPESGLSIVHVAGSKGKGFAVVAEEVNQRSIPSGESWWKKLKVRRGRL